MVERDTVEKLWKRRWVRLSVDAILTLLVVGAVMGWQTRHLLGGGEQAPAFALRDLDGKTWRLEDLKGKPVLLTFWAPWCGVCKAESPNLSAVRSAVGEDAQVISVALGWEDLGAVQRYVSDQQVDYPVLLGNEQIREAFRIEAFPTTYFISEDGRIKHTTVGYTSELGMRLRLKL
jgi:peroxiredoxin